MKLLIGNKRYSSWSLRPWLLMRSLGIAFVEEIIPYHHADWHERVFCASGSRTLPALLDGQLRISESIAILEHLHERFPDAGVWPRDAVDRARARSLAAEVHAGFAAIRQEFGLDVLRDGPERPLSPASSAELARLQSIWGAQVEDGRPFLFGAFCAVDAMFAPFALRLSSYRVPLQGPSLGYAKRLLCLPAMREWVEGARAERDWPQTSPGAGPRPAFSRPEDVEAIARAWIAAWNARDLPAVVALFEPDAVIRNAGAAAVTGESVVRGHEALQRYWARALDKVSALHFELDEVLWDERRNGALVRYRAHLDERHVVAAKFWRLTASGRIAEGDALYGATL
jgi:glutathione S-transferase